MGERLLCKQEVVGSIPSASSCVGVCAAGGCAAGDVAVVCGVMESEGLGFGGWITAVGRGLALGAWGVCWAGGAGGCAVVLYGL